MKTVIVSVFERAKKTALEEIDLLTEYDQGDPFDIAVAATMTHAKHAEDFILKELEKIKHDRRNGNHAVV